MPVTEDLWNLLALGTGTNLLCLFLAFVYELPLENWKQIGKDSQEINNDVI